MRLWTIQDEFIYNIIITEGKYVCDGNKSEHLEWNGFKRAYNWLSKKMKEKIGESPNENDYPVWAWSSKPDLRKSCWGAKGKKCVLLEIEIDDKDVFITDFDNWHCVLNSSPFIDIDDIDEWEREYDRVERLRGEEYTKTLEESWEKIIYDEIPNNGRNVQVTFWELKKEDLISYRFFTAR